MLESMRAYGYSLATAIADIIDNSISAKARNIWLNFHWSGPKSHISIQDDGQGMLEEDLKKAMRPGSQNPLLERSPTDLGRFGLGLKTASFSQCRCLSVASKVTNGSVAIRRWDLNYIAEVDDWRLLRTVAKGSEHKIAPLESLPSGTIILWENIDRIVGNEPTADQKAMDRFLERINLVEEHLAMVFHRFLESNNPILKIYVNGSEGKDRVKPWDPFLESNPATSSFPTEKIPFGNGNIEVKGYVLPHKDKLGDKVHKVASGPAGWNAQQGFYVYRNKRMLVPGSWLGIGSGRSWTKEEHYKLARIRIDIPNSMDSEWQIDVKKSTARPPSFLKSKLKTIADMVRKKARKVFAHRGFYGHRKEKFQIQQIWQSAARNGRTVYRIDREHPMVKAVVKERSGNKKLINALLKYIEETVPVQKIWMNSAEDQTIHARPFQNVPEILRYGGINIVEKIAQDLDKQGYRVQYTLLNSVFYGVPQFRERMFLMAFRRELSISPQFPEQTHFHNLPLGYLHWCKKITEELEMGPSPYFKSSAIVKGSPLAVTCREAMNDLPVIETGKWKKWKNGPVKFDTLLPYTKEVCPSSYASKMRTWEYFEADEGVWDHVIRYQPRDFPLFAAMKPGDRYPEAHAIAWKSFTSELERKKEPLHKNSSEYFELKKSIIPPYDTSKFKDRWRKLKADEPSHTLTAHLGKDCYSHIHYCSKQARTISVREAARLQSFPDGFKFVGYMSGAFRQIGNSVPPLLARVLANSIKNQLYKKSLVAIPNISGAKAK